MRSQKFSNHLDQLLKLMPNLPGENVPGAVAPVATNNPPAAPLPGSGSPVSNPDVSLVPARSLKNSVRLPGWQRLFERYYEMLIHDLMEPEDAFKFADRAATHVLERYGELGIGNGSV